MCVSLNILLLRFQLASGFTRCDFTGKDGVVRTKYVIPEALKKVAFLKNFKYPADHSKIPCIILFIYTKIPIFFDICEVGSAAADTKSSTTTASAEVKEEDDNAPEDDVPVGKELYLFFPPYIHIHHIQR